MDTVSVIQFMDIHNSIMMLMKFAHPSQSDHSNWVMWQVQDRYPRVSDPGKIAFIKIARAGTGIRSLAPHLIRPLLIGPPTHWSLNALLELIGTPFHWSPCHWSPISLVPLFIRHPIIGQSQWSPISLVPHLIGSPSHWSPNSSVPHLIGPPISTHASPIPLVPPTHWSPISLVPFSLVPRFISPQLHIDPLFIDPPNFGQSQWSPILLVPYLIGPPIGTYAAPIPLVPLCITRVTLGDQWDGGPMRTG